MPGFKTSPGCKCCETDGPCGQCVDSSGVAKAVSKWTVEVSGWPATAEAPLTIQPGTRDNPCQFGTKVWWQKSFYEDLGNLNRSDDFPLDGSGGCVSEANYTGETDWQRIWYLHDSESQDCPTDEPSCDTTKTATNRKTTLSNYKSGSDQIVDLDIPFVPGLVTFTNPTCAEQSKSVQTTFSGSDPDGCGAGDDISITVKLSGTKS